MKHTRAAADTSRPGVPYQQPVEDVLAALGTEAQRGLTEDEARLRLERHGRNELTVEPGGAIDGTLRLELDRVLRVADRANNAVLQEREGRWTIQGDPTEGALIVAARKAGLQAQALMTRFERVGEVPFSSTRKLMSTVHTDADRRERVLVFTKGAPDVLLTRCTEELIGEGRRPLSDERRQEILSTNDALAARALRTLGVAFRSLPAVVC